jgi:anti-anti-sigma factor
MWHRLSLRTRILLGYGVGLVIMAGLVGLLLVRLEAINATIVQLNTNAASDADIGVRLAGDVAAAQQSVNRYLQQPQEALRQQAHKNLDALQAEMAQQRPRLTGASQQARAADLAAQVDRYSETFHALDLLLYTQVADRFDTSRYITQASALTNHYIYGELNDHSTDKLNTLITTQTNLQSAAITASRMMAEQDPNLADLARARLRLAKARLEGLALNSPGNTTLRDAVTATTQAISATNQLADNLALLKKARTTELNDRSNALQQSANAIAQDALGALTTATSDVGQQMRQTEQAAIVALLAALLVTLVMGIQLARTLTKPLDELVAATERINQGDYGRPVAAREGGEVGRLIGSFNLMTSTLRSQRAEVARQQAAMAERNCELERALQQLQAATAEREALASTVRMLSVPVIPILEQVIVLPLVGELDEERAQLLLERLLDGVVTQRARIAILDITGLAMIDMAGATWLLQAAGAVELLGARTILAGTSPETAQALVASGADLGRLHSTIDLRAAVEYALRRVGDTRRSARAKPAREQLPSVLA